MILRVRKMRVGSSDHLPAQNRKLKFLIWKSACPLRTERRTPLIPCRFRDYCTEKRPSKQDSRDLFSQKQFSIKFLAASLVSDDPRPEVLTWISDKDFTISDPNADCATIPYPTNLIRGETIKTASKRQTLCPFWMGINIMIEGSRRSVLNGFVLNGHSTLQVVNGT